MANVSDSNGAIKPMQDVAAGFGGSGDRVQLIDDDNPVGEREIPTSPGSEPRSEISPLQLEGADGLQSKKKTQEGLKVIIISSVSFAITITIALIVTIFVGPPAVEPHGAVACDSQQCSDIGVELMKQGGSAVDAAIGSLLCMGVVNPHHSGIGGGLMMLIRQHKENTSMVINARETAPSAADESLYTNPDLLQKGNLAVAVPGALRGMQAAHDKYGKLSWEDVVKPAAQLARKGFIVDKNLAYAVANSIDTGSDLDTDLVDMFTTADGDLVVEGDTMVSPGLASVLDKISADGPEWFYSGKNAKEIADATAGFITVDDLANYKISQGETLKKAFNNMTIETMPAPGGGPLVLFILHVLQNYTLSAANETDPLFYHRLVETIKFMVGEKARFGDPDFVTTIANDTELLTSMKYAAEIRAKINDNKTHNTGFYLNNAGVTPEAGTAHVSVIGPNEDMVSVTSTINQHFGSHVVTPSGIILNDQMGDFDLPTTEQPNPNNKLEPGKRPLSSMSPTIVHRFGKPCASRIAVGGVNGSQIISGVAEVLLNILVFDKNITGAIEANRISNTLAPDQLLYNKGFPANILKDLENRGHTDITMAPRGINYIHAVAKINETVMAHGDSREGGSGSSIY